MNDNQHDIEPLFFGDMRIDNLINALEKEIYARAKGKIPIISIIGSLDLIKHRLLMQVDE